MKHDPKFTQRVQNYLESPKDSRNLEEGAMLLLKLTGNTIMYQQIMRNPAKYASHIEYQLQKNFNFRIQQVTHEQVEEMQSAADHIINNHLSLQEDNPASEFQKGKRADHDSLPDNIKQAYVDNKSILQRMRMVRAELEIVTTKPGHVCPDSDRYPLLKELLALDKQRRDNWALYDNYNPATGCADTTDDARAASKKAVGYINLNKGKYRNNPTEELRAKLAEAYNAVLNPTEKMTAELKELGVI